MADRNFSRMGQPIRIPFTAGSAAVQFDMVGHGIPRDPATGKILDDMSVAFINETGFDVRLEGYPDGVDFVGVTASTGWSILARTDKGPFLSKKPTRCSVQAFSTQANPIPANADFTGCYLELVYGRGR